VTLHADRSGAGPPVVLVHGFTQNRRCWGSLPASLARRHRVIAVDAPGHGRSSDVRADLWETAAHLAIVDDHAAFVGYSMGARMVLHTAITHPERVDRLVLVSGTAGIDDPAERTARRERDDELAASIERDGLYAFLTRWLDQPLFATLPPDARDEDARRENTVEGLASSLRLAGTGTQEPLWERLRALAMPVLLVTGALDERFTAHATRMAALIGSNATVHAIDDAGHACHRERPDEFARVLEAWLDQGT
jgi:2-succinyl-6-hydroxy-2,4-cyclohexadiene-1-carboxylate synthase